MDPQAPSENSSHFIQGDLYEPMPHINNVLDSFEDNTRILYTVGSVSSIPQPSCLRSM